MDDRGFFLTWQAVSKQLAAMPSELYLVRLIHTQSRCAFPGERLWSAGQREPGRWSRREQGRRQAPAAAVARWLGPTATGRRLVGGGGPPPVDAGKAGAPRP